MCKSMHTRGKNLICKYLLGLTMTKLVSHRSMSVYVDLKVCAVQFVYNPWTHTYFTCRCYMGASQWQIWCPTDICICNFTGLPSCIHTYGHKSLHAGAGCVSCSGRVGALHTSIYLQVCTYCTVVYTLVHCKYMYTDVCTYCTVVYIHMDIYMYMYIIIMTHSGAQCASHSDRVCALQVDVCIPVLCSCRHKHGCVYIHTGT